jgi:predicted MPP superfamily phosphohydrolase
MKRRFFLKSILAALGVGVTTGLYAWQIEPFWLEFVNRSMPIRHLPAGLEGKTLLQISDIHVGNRFNWNFIIRSFEKAQELAPDIVVYTGDYISYLNAEQFVQLETVMKSAVKGRLGTFAILGNHDYGLNWTQQEVGQKVVEILENTGIRVLRNEHVEVAGLHLYGFDDFWGPNFQPQNALQHYRTDQPGIVLCHNPDACDEDIWGNYQGWILSGHTHGGQCKPPFLPAPLLPVKNKKYTAGEFDLKDGRKLYINRDLGHLWQVRFNVRPEITVFRLEKEEI